MTILRSSVLILCVLFAITTQAQDLAFSSYQSPDVTGFFTNNGRITDQHGNSRPDIYAAFHGRNFQAFFTASGWNYQIKKSLNKPSSPLDVLNKKFRDTLLVQQVSFSWLFPVSETNRYKFSSPAGPWVNVYRENFAAENLRAHKNITWETTADGIRFDFSWLSDVRIKYNIVLDPGADTRQLSCVITGAEEVILKDGGKTLEMATAAGNIQEHIPMSWQVAPDGTKIPVMVRWSLHGDTAGFVMPDNYNPLLPLVIDPWSTYLGGTGGAGRDTGEDVATDASLNVYATGLTTSLFNIATTGTFQTTLSGVEDIYLIRYNSTGARQWCTYYGGTLSDYVSSVSASGTNFLFMSMGTYNSGLATTGTHQVNLQGSTDALICRMNPANGQRLWATYYGGPSDDFPTAIETDAAGNVYLTGYTLSSSGIATPGAFKTTLALNDVDGFIARFTSSGARSWATYYGGGNVDYSQDITVDIGGNILIGGVTLSLTNIATTGTHQTTLRGSSDGFVARFNASGSRLWGTYYGGAQDESILCIATDASGRVYAGGETSSSTFIATPGAFKTTLTGPSRDAFLFRLNTNGTMNYATYYGGENDEAVIGIKTDALNNTYFSGYTNSTTSIATAGAAKTTLTGSSDAFVGKFSNAGARLWCTYYGGPDFEFCGKLTLDATANVIITGYTTSSTGIAVNATQSTLSGFINAFVAKYTTNGVLPVTWLSVTAQPLYNHVMIQWSTSTETNNDFFTVEHSTDGSLFTELSQINGAGNSTVVQTYSYIHTEPASGTQYYRIRQTDFNGTFDFSDVVVVNLRASAIKLSGYISSGKLILTTPEQEGELQWVSLVNGAGQNVTPAGAGTITDISHLPAGVYTAVLLLNGEPQTWRFIK
jgi:hypothetical protein